MSAFLRSRGGLTTAQVNAQKKKTRGEEDPWEGLGHLRASVAVLATLPDMVKELQVFEAVENRMVIPGQSYLLHSRAAATSFAEAFMLKGARSTAAGARSVE